LVLSSREVLSIDRGDAADGSLGVMKDS